MIAAVAALLCLPACLSAITLCLFFVCFLHLQKHKTQKRLTGFNRIGNIRNRSNSIDNLSICTIYALQMHTFKHMRTNRKEEKKIRILSKHNKVYSFRCRKKKKRKENVYEVFACYSWAYEIAN